MKPVTKVLIAGCSLLIVIAIAAAAAIAWFVSSRSSQWIAQGKAVRKEGSSFGLTASESQCLNEAMARYRRSTGMISGVRQGVWLGGCLETSAVEADFCTDVPPTDEMIRTVTWRTRRCTDFGFSGDSTCPNILAEVQRYCQSDVRRKKAALPHE